VVVPSHLVVAVFGAAIYPLLLILLLLLLSLMLLLLSRPGSDLTKSNHSLCRSLRLSRTRANHTACQTHSFAPGDFKSQGARETAALVGARDVGYTGA